MVKAIFFDWHGVLDNHTFGGLLELLAHVSGKSLDQIICEYGKLADDWARGDVTAKECWDIIGKQFNAEQVSKAKDYIYTLELNKPLWRALPTLKQQYYLGVLSDCPDKKTNIIKEKATLNIFNATYFSSDHNMIKRDPAFFNLVTNGSGFTAIECLFVDDSQKNIDFAKNLGFQTHLFNNTNAFLKFLRTLE